MSTRNSETSKQVCYEAESSEHRRCQSMNKRDQLASLLYRFLNQQKRNLWVRRGEEEATIWKGGKGECNGNISIEKPNRKFAGWWSGKEQKQNRWQVILNSGVAALDHSKWTEEDENWFQSLKTKKLTLKDTALGRLWEQNKRELKSSFLSKTAEDRAALLEELKTMHEGGGDVMEAAI